MIKNRYIYFYSLETNKQVTLFTKLKHSQCAHIPNQNNIVLGLWSTVMFYFILFRKD